MESKIEYKELFKRISSCVAIYKAAGDGNDFIFKDFNKAAEKADKIKRKDVIGKSVLEIFPGIKDFGLFDVFKRVYKTGKPESHAISCYKDSRISGWRENFVYKIPNGNIVAVYNDLTEKKQAEEELALANELLELAQKSAGVGIWDWDMNIDKLNWSSEFYILFGLDPKKDTATFDTWYRVIHPEDRQTIEDSLNKSIIEKKPRFQEYRIIMPSGKIRWINTMGNTIYDAHGKAVRMSGICIDITERKKAEETLLVKDQAIQSSINAIAISEFDGTLTYVNPSFLRLWGYDSEKDVLGKFVGGGWSEKEKVNEVIAVLQNNGSWSGEMVAKKKDGSTFFAQLSANMITTHDGKLIYMMASFIDITERKQIEHALKERYKELSCLYNVTSLAELRNISLDKLLERAVMLLPPAWQFPEITEACIILEGLTFQTERFRETSWMQVSEIVAGENTIGQVKICYLEKRQESDEGPFLKEERVLIDTIALKLGQIVLRVRSEETLKESEEKYRTLFDTSAEGILIAEVETHKFKYANPAICQMLGYTQKELTAMDISAIHRKEDLQSVLTKFQDQISGKYPIVGDIPCLKKNGTIFYADINSAIITIDDQRCIAGFFHDTTERKKTEQEIQDLSFHDHLTGLYNRRFFEEELNRLNTKRQLPLSFIMGDLNGLKLINDVFGHNEGDNLLVKTAEILKKICRSDDILARWGGDEFVILLPRTSITDSEEIVERIVKECKKTKRYKIPIILSLGTATKEMSVQDIQAIIIDAESNMYRNKLAQKESSTSSIISVLEQALYEKSTETKEHTDRVRDLALKLGKSVNLHASQLDETSLLASLHDIGKVAISETILAKEGKLTKQEWEVIKRHPEIGFNITSSSPQIAHIAKAILSCHENWDGSGYPMGIAGESIPIISRIILISDTYDVMTRGRTYKDPMSKDDAIKEFKRYAGTQFDPILVDKFIEIISN